MGNGTGGCFVRLSVRLPLVRLDLFSASLKLSLSLYRLSFWLSSFSSVRPRAIAAPLLREHDAHYVHCLSPSCPPPMLSSLPIRMGFYGWGRAPRCSRGWSGVGCFTYVPLSTLPPSPWYDHTLLSSRKPRTRDRSPCVHGKAYHVET